MKKSSGEFDVSGKEKTTPVKEVLCAGLPPTAPALNIRMAHYRFRWYRIQVICKLRQKIRERLVFFDHFSKKMKFRSCRQEYRMN
jgi:hypothetical protein